MNETLQLLMGRRSVRAYDGRPIDPKAHDQIIAAAIRAPTAGNMMLYSIIEVDSQEAKDKLAVSCDDQPFIAKAPLVLLFLADYQRLHDYHLRCGMEESCRRRGAALQRPEEGDLFLACCDALIAAQTSVIAAEALGIGSCYIGDIIENYEMHRDLFGLPPYTFPICLLCYGYPLAADRARPLSKRFDREFIVFRDRYHRLGPEEFDRMYSDRASGPPPIPGSPARPGQVRTPGEANYTYRFTSQFAAELRRSVRVMLATWARQG